jgi:hypothetical protein
MEDRSPVTPTSPIPFVEQIGQVYVVREDLIPGGSKRRFIDRLLQSPHNEYVYAATAYGGAQIALALAAKQMNKRVTLFVAKRKILHPRTQAAQDAGAQIIGVPMGFLSVVYARARAYCQTTGACLLPLGFDSEEALEAIASTAALVRKQYGQFDEVWAAVGTGTLLRGLQRADLGKSYFGVAVGRNANKCIGAAKLIQHPQPFAADALITPPFPSCSNYDAKVWEYVSKRPNKRVLFWNVMG